MGRFEAFKKRLVEFSIRNDDVNKPFKRLERIGKAYIALEWGLVLVLWVGALSLIARSPSPDDKVAVRAWLLSIMAFLLVWGLVWGFLIHWRLRLRIDKLRRELWFIEHRLGLPHEPEELEDIDAYKKWLEEQVKKKIGGDAR